MSRGMRCFSMRALLAIALLVPGARADAAPAAPLEERVTIELVDADPRDALRSFSQLTGLPFDVDPLVKTPFTATLRNVRVRTALDVLCESVGCAWQESGGGVRVVAVSAKPAEAPAASAPSGGLAEPISLSLKAAAGRRVLEMFAQILSADAAVAPEIDGEVTIELQAVPVSAGLDRVCAQLHCSWALEPGGPKPVLRVRKIG